MSNNPPGTASLTIPARHGIAKLRFQLDGQLQEEICTFGFHVLEFQLTQADVAVEPNLAAVSICDAFEAHWDTNAFCNGWAFHGCDTQIWLNDQTAGEPPVASFAGTEDRLIVGNSGSVSVPPNCSALVRKHTGMGGRYNQGRMYWPAASLGSAYVDKNGMWGTAQAGSLKTSLDAFFLDLTDNNVNIVPVVLHGMRKVGANVIAAGQPTPVTSWSVDRQLATQRRRMR